MINLILKVLGFGKAVDALDGETSKAYAGGLGLILTGAGSVAGGLAGLIGEFQAAHGGAAYLAIAQGIPKDMSAGLVLAGWASISQGIAVIGQRHALAKAQADAATPIAPAPEAPKAP